MFNSCFYITTAALVQDTLWRHVVVTYRTTYRTNDTIRDTFYLRHCRCMFCCYCGRLQNTTICEQIKKGMSRSVCLDSKIWITGMCLFILRVYSERFLIENGKKLEHNTTKHATTMSKIECEYLKFLNRLYAFNKVLCVLLSCHNPGNIV
jgi:hypothetical protein